MTDQAILIASIFLLLAFGVERLGKLSGIPSVVILILIGLVGKPVMGVAGLELSGLNTAVPVIGTIGLILIVLEGAFDIDLRKDKLRHAKSAFFTAGVGLITCTVLFALAAYVVFGLSILNSLILAVPFSVISSAVAIPSSTFLPAEGREFVVYESSASDILGILIFFTLLSSDGALGGTLSKLIGGGLLSFALGSICAIALMLILVRIEGHIRFIPLLAGLFALYAGGKIMHLSPLIMVLLFGLVINNPRFLTRFRWFKGLADNNVEYEATLGEFKTLTMELTFAVRGFFFILLGYWTDLSTLTSPAAWISAMLIMVVILGTRLALLRWQRLELAEPLTWIAPRGLITVLLFLAAKDAIELPEFLDGAVLLVVFTSAVVVTVGRLRWVKAETARAC
jgi:NhaP-type Na+/H+ or K+/H+ antiporter